jgi:methionyl-tRNA synthetase
MQPSKFYVTTPIYYVNDKPHIGHAYTTILADVLARYHRLLEVPTWFLTGTDEHGQKVQKAAEAAGITPQQQADQTVVRFQDLWKRLDITHDDFIRTTEPRHKIVVQKILQDLHDRGEIYRAEYDGWYCVPDERFFTEKDLDDGKCPECHRPVERIQEANYFFKMSQYQDWLIRHIQEHPKFIQPDSRRNETLGFLKKPLNDLCISRPKSRMSWGIDLPFDTNYVCYVWFDALVNYISAVGYLSDDAKFKKWWPASVHLIGKDILTTHTVYWPTMLKAMGVELPETVFAHGWWLVGESKMSKSLGNVISPMDMIDRYGVDAFRYFVMAEMILGQDAHFTEDAFVRRYNADLANDLGNLLNRVLNMTVRYCGGRIPAPETDALDRPEEKELWAVVQNSVAATERAVSEMRIHESVGAAVEAVRAINRYFELKQPWTLGKQADRTPLHTVLYAGAEALRVVATLLFPIMPAKMNTLRHALGLGRSVPSLAHLRTWGRLKPGSTVKETGPLFPRIVPGDQRQLEFGASAPAVDLETRQTKESEIMENKETPPETPKQPAPPTPVAPVAAQAEQVALIEYTDFTKVQLRTARIVSAEKVEGTTKLLRIEIIMGEDRRQVVAGIALHYEPEQLVGKTVVVVANVKPATIRGVESQGMLLAASKGEKMRLITVDGDLSSGAVVK